MTMKRAPRKGPSFFRHDFTSPQSQQKNNYYVQSASMAGLFTTSIAEKEEKSTFHRPTQPKKIPYIYVLIWLGIYFYVYTYKLNQTNMYI